MLKLNLHLIRSVALMVAIFVFPHTAFSRERTRTPLEDRLLAGYKDKPQMLLGFYCGKKLKFDADANLRDVGRPGPWTVCGDVHVQDIQIKQDEIVIKAHRIYLYYDQQKISFQDVDLGVPKKDKNDKDRWQERELEIRVAQTKNADETGIRATLDKLFRSADADFFDLTPDYWKSYLEGRKKNKTGEEIHKEERLTVTKPIAAPARLSGNDGKTPPHAIHAPDPEFSDEARQYKFQGTVLIKITVDTNGSATDVRIVRPLGLGLDEKAAEAVKKWRFVPAKQNDGTPIATAAVIEVTFRLY